MVTINLDDCWLSARKLTKQGYARLMVWYPEDRRSYGFMLHRVMYEEYIGKVPEGYVVDHLCRVKHCINPTHLEAVTSATNTKRGWKKNKMYCKHGHRFTPENTIVRPDGRRNCRECTKRSHRESNRRNYYPGKFSKENRKRS